MAITGLDHVQVAIPRGGEDLARGFYGELLGMREVAKPSALAVRGGCWFESGTAVLHLGVEDPFAPAQKAHPAFLVSDLDDLHERLAAEGHNCVRGDGEIPGVRRFHTFDPFGNRIVPAGLRSTSRPARHEELLAAGSRGCTPR
ncbi:VOC family protein [Janibacter sp. GXQ6167]|uniref:VOC family protein n=1 Tax=Janibacter sp. GXQ6167 TaxID=3240791 RepID=UPI003523869E